jgi:hypothetical protein
MHFLMADRGCTFRLEEGSVAGAKGLVLYLDSFTCAFVQLE